ncbi:type III polyketide synthase [Sulfitobacter guttiformis]|uniref:(2-(2,4-dihydroxy-6-methylphenyl)-2-oxoethyl)-4-hydroxy-2-pyrone synthase n=1 Tax=Sulfitobacter guttiformis TaxID=74349 RepID=A0A420DQL7_9RHOB|nr:chalcone synthase [Sulfitobacter guttiformis]KIN73900.1 Naringenin-chalcone synthase [Sulfitobacter guttiformis KCTC 32187]RKE96532.1 (2-(2,4-dihydroxy-6-methylphenyl)-2- oxoethyl)-4-hydroxy-2-pyrone synthase [Sulfitobacter guttiformis]
MSVYLHGLSTALPPHCLTQSEVKERAAVIFSQKYPQFDRLSKTFETAGIDRRYSVVPIDWFSAEHGWSDRNTAFISGAKSMFIAAAQRALEDAGWSGAEVDCVVTVTSTGIATPSLEAQVFGEMGFREDIMRVPVFGLGCAGGVSGLSTAQILAAGRPGSKVLLVVVEACSLSFRADRLQNADIIATVLFGDGSAAACICTDLPAAGNVVTLGRGHQKIWPDTLDIMGWDVDEAGFGVVFDRSIPAFVSAEFAVATKGALEAADLDHVQIDRYVCHPGGAKVVDAIEDALHLEHGSLDAERDTLRTTGNMSAPTVMFVIKAVLQAGHTGQMMSCALGPGFTASFLPFQVSAQAA